MPRVRSPFSGSPTPLPNARRLLGLWWRRQSPSRQDRFATLGPLVSVLLFLAAIISAFWYLRNEEIERETESVKRDAEITQQQIGLRLIQNQEQLIRLARELMTRETDANGFLNQAVSFTRERPEITHFSWVGANRVPKASHWTLLYAAENNQPGDVAGPALPNASGDTESELAFRAARSTRLPAYSHAFTDAGGSAVFQLHMPLIEQGQFTGALIVEYSVDSLLRNFVPAEVSRRHMIAVVDETQKVLAST
ncbi:MAG: PAS domain-containing sensor histidine kinase, partial [Rubrivivax sp.]